MKETKVTENKPVRRRVLLIIRWPIGGIRTFIRYVYRLFDSSKYSLTILAPDIEELRLLLTDLEDFDIEYIPLPADVSISQFLIAIIRTLTSGKYHVIHSQGFTAGVLSVIPGFIMRCPHLLTVHDVFNWPQFKGPKGVMKKLGLSLVLPLVDRIHAVSHDAKENLLEYVPSLRIFKQKVLAIPNGIETARFIGDEKLDLRGELNLQQDSFLIGFFGRFMSQKGFVYLADAVHRLLLKPDLPKRPLVLAFGEGSYIREEQIDLRRKGIYEHFRFLPFVPNIAPVLRGLDVIAMPSLWEACGLLAMEAMVAGVPLIGTDCIGLREVLKGTPSVMVPARSSVALAEALVAEIISPSKVKAKLFRDEAVSRFDVSGQAKELAALVQSLIACRQMD